MKPTPRTWLLVLLALVLSGIIAWLETRDRVSAGATAPEDPGEYTVDVELAPGD